VELSQRQGRVEEKRSSVNTSDVGEKGGAERRSTNSSVAARYSVTGNENIVRKPTFASYESLQGVTLGEVAGRRRRALAKRRAASAPIAEDPQSIQGARDWSRRIEGVYG